MQFLLQNSNGGDVNVEKGEIFRLFGYGQFCSFIWNFVKIKMRKMKKRIAMMLLLLGSVNVMAVKQEPSNSRLDSEKDQKTGTQSADLALSYSFGKIKPPNGIAAEIVAKMQQAPSNPDVTCIRARVAVKIA